MRVARRAALVLLACGSASALSLTAPGCRCALAPRHRAVLLAADDETAAERRRLQIQELEACLHVATLEERAERAERESDLVGAIAAYEELLALQPPESPALHERCNDRHPTGCAPSHDPVASPSPPRRGAPVQPLPR